MHCLGSAEDHHRRCRHKWRVQALRQRDAIEAENDKPTADNADDRAETQFASELQRNPARRAVAERQ